MAEQDKTIMCFTRWLLIQTKCLTHTWRGVGWELCLLWRVKTNTSSLTRALPWVCFTRSCSRTYVFTLCLDWIISSLVSLYHTPVPRTRTSPSHTHTHTHTLPGKGRSGILFHLRIHLTLPHSAETSFP